MEACDIMRPYSLIVVSFALGLLLAGPAVAEHCRPGEVTISQFINGLTKTQTGWGELGAADAMPCQVNLIRGDGEIPKQCMNAKKLTATGTVRHMMGMSFLHVSKISCE